MRARDTASRYNAAGFLQELLYERFLGRRLPVQPGDERQGRCPARGRRGLGMCTAVAAAVIAVGCASGPSPRPSPEGLPEAHAAASPNRGFFVSPDEALFYAGILHMEASGKTTDYTAVRRTFETLLQTHPDSKWCGPARSCLGLLAEREELIAKGRQAEQETAECRKKAAEAAAEAQNVRLANEKLRSEAAKIQQENDQVKKDLQRLKELEIELQNRNRLLR